MLALLGSLVLACSGLHIATDFDPEADFSGLRSWAWLPEPPHVARDPRIDNDLLDRRIRRAVVDQLAAQGFQGPDSAAPDFQVGYHVAIASKLDVRSVDEYYGRAGPWGRSRGTYAGTRTYVTEYEQGSLILDVVEPRSKRLLWRGSAEARVDARRSPEEREERVREAVRRILERFPPQEG